MTTDRDFFGEKCLACHDGERDGASPYCEECRPDPSWLELEFADDDDPVEELLRCKDCGCSGQDHDHPKFGGGCGVCGIDCAGYR